MGKFTDEASIYIGRNSFIPEGKSGAYEVVVFGGSKQFHKSGNLIRNYRLGKDFTNKKDARKYQSRLVLEYNKFVKKHPELDLDEQKIGDIEVG